MCKILGFPFGRRDLPRLDARKKRAGEKPPRASRTGQDPAILTYRDTDRIRRSGPTTPPCRWRSPDRHRIKNGHYGPTERHVKIRRSPPTEIRAGSGDPALQPPSVDGDRQIAIGTGAGDAAFISPALPPQTSSTHDAQATQAPATDASLTSQAYHQMRPPQSGSNAQHPASPTYQ